MLTCDEYLTPLTLDAAFAAMERHRGRYRLIAGATDTLPWAREGRAGDVAVPVLIDIAKIPELKERRIDGKVMRIGAATPFQRFLDDLALAAAMPCMSRCAVWFADDQIREQATIGGNLVNASPAADGTPPLLAHGASVELASYRGGKIERRTLPLDQFILGPGKTAIAPDEILVAVTCDALTGYGGDFQKVGHRRSLVISLVCLAVLVRLDADKAGIADARIAIGGIGPVPIRLTEIESMLRGRRLSESLLRQAADMPVDLVRSRTRQTYRRDVVYGFMLRGLLNAVSRAGGDVGAAMPELEAAYG